MDLNNVIKNLREEFGKQLDTALAQEVRQRKLEEAELENLAEVLPEVFMPPLSEADEKKALKIKDDLDKKVEKLAELTAEIGQESGEYKKQVGELRGLLAGKKHNIYSGHTGNKLSFMLKTISTILENDTVNATLGFRSLPDKFQIEGKLNKYVGI